MYHFDESQCDCTIFFNKDLFLKMLSIHDILVQCEEYFLEYQNFDKISDFYNIESLGNITFFVFVKFQHASQHKVKRFAAECNLLDFFDYLKHTFDLSKIFDVSIRMMNQDEFKLWVRMKIRGFDNFELIGGCKYWNDVKEDLTTEKK